MRGFGGDCQAGLSRWRRRGWCASRQAADGAVAAIPVRRSAWPRLASGAESPERDRTAGGRIGAAARAFDQRASHRYAALHARAHSDATGDRPYDRDLGRGAQDATDGNLSNECRKVAPSVVWCAASSCRKANSEPQNGTIRYGRHSTRQRQFFPRAPSRDARVRHRQRLGRGIGARSGGPRLCGDRHLQLRDCRRIRHAKAGADVLMAPGLPDLASVKAVCAAIAKPFNFMVGIPGKSFTVAELEAAGVRRISLAGSLYRTAMGGLVAAAHELKDKGTFGYVDTALPSAELAGFMRG